MTGTHGETCDRPEETLASLILAQARRTPDAVALRQWDRRLSYAELAASAGQLARYGWLGLAAHRSRRSTLTCWRSGAAGQLT